MRTIKIEMNNEMHATWLKLMIENEIKNTEGAISNERIGVLMHEMNIQHLIEYQEELEWALHEISEKEDKEMKIEITVYDEIHAALLKMMLEDEISDTEGTIDNEELFEKGSDGEAAFMHRMNMRNLIEYKNELKSALLAMEDV